MKLNGIDETNHKIFVEIERNRNFIKMIREAEEGKSSVDPNMPGSEPMKKIKVDTVAASRMAKHHLASNQETVGTSSKSRRPIFLKLRLGRLIRGQLCLKETTLIGRRKYKECKNKGVSIKQKVQNLVQNLRGS